MELLLATISLLVGCVTVWRWSLSTSRNSQLPPGPPGHWFWGNDFPKKLSFIKFYEWSKEYGPVFSLRRGRRVIVVVNGYKAAMDILEKEGVSSADRPQNIAASDILSGGKRLLLLGVGERFRKSRKALHKHLYPRMAASYEPLQAFNAKILIRDILDDADDHWEHAKRYAGSVILSLTYGKPSPSNKSDPNVAIINEGLVRVGEASRPGAYYVEQLPWLKYIPFYGMKLRRWHREELAMFREQLNGVRDDMAKGKARPSFGRYLVEKQENLGLSDDEAAYLAGSMFGAGSETTASGISVVIMAAALYPEAQAAVARELDKVVGPDRLPSYSDWDLLPQVHAFYLEAARWRPGVAGGFQHSTTKDILWNGYHIPAGATIIGNHWAIGRDPEIFPDGDEFKSGRWFDKDGKVKPDMKFPAFGFGRRICPGAEVATRSMFINTAFLLWSFRIKTDPKRPIDTLAFREGVITLPLPFAVQFETRRSGLREMLSMNDGDDEVRFGV
ncbi:cytochrome P450 [Stereum hirsutum FP-91666 SS1]|uniref:cytochrome P450 n=1 Tax=Stereum hirsutum (strain FP-91666) TaxID=721885 RepID=UPI000440A68E|nr:cytochrome P450 [Stereum hirsutum FP-91666 SS1]EIM88728.1 cytochrome P450 [Stereum hirsutum FP-91666 SS1]